MIVFRFYTQSGGLITYGPNCAEQFRRQTTSTAFSKGARPADLPVQAPTKNELVINLETARTLGLTVPPLLLIGAEEVIE
jgi:putative ABC transport system substrate-binding protein